MAKLPESAKQPDWTRILVEKAEQRAAKLHWSCIVSDMLEREIFSSSNRHAVQRLVLAYIVYDRCSKLVAAEGLVVARNEENPKSIDRLSIDYKAMREAEDTAERLEAQLGLSPGHRSKVGKVARKKERSTGADAFLGPKA